MPFKSNKQRRWMHSNKPEMAQQFEKYPDGGMLTGESHARGGIPIEAEGGEYIIKKDSVNQDTINTLEHINEHGDLPVSDARERRNQ
tara:strand:- start:234 stop:494 length:261 start_codon:yes stop_codon:yes gene_type:complete